MSSRIAFFLILIKCTLTSETDEEETISSPTSYSSINAQRRRMECNFNGIDLLQTMNRHRIEFDQTVYIMDNVSVNSLLGSSLLEFSVQYQGRPTEVKRNNLQYNISSLDDTFILKHLHSIGSRSFYSLVLNRQLDYFINPQHRYQFKLIAYSPNQPSLYSRAWVQISLRNFNCHAPVFISEQEMTVSEIALPGHIVGVVQAVDPDGDKVLYIQKNLHEKFKVDEKSGVISVVKQLVTAEDRHVKFHQLIVEAADDASSCPPSGMSCGVRKNETVLKIKITDVNKEAPTFTSPICGKSIEILEHMDTNNSIALLTAVDNDRGDNGRIEFFFPDVSSKNNAYQKFRLEPHEQHGPVRNVSIYATESFDFDAPQAINTFFLLVFAQDSGRQRRQGFCFLKISVIDRNDNKPIFVVPRWNYQLRNTSHLIENGRRLFRVIASDKDTGENGRVQYFIANESKYFDVERDTGFIKFKNKFIDDKDFPQRFQVFATDSAVQPKRSERNAEVVITLSGSGDAELEWMDDKFNDFSVNISEKFHSKYALANIKDPYFDGNITFIGYGGISNPRFRLSPRPEDTLFVASKTRVIGAIPGIGGTKYLSGIRVTNELDAEVKDQHYLYMRVEDIAGLQSLVGLCRVFVLDENDQIPFFDSSELRLSLLEGNWSEESIGQVQAFDQDRTHPNNYVRYRLRQGESEEVKRMFSVRENGEIVAHGYFDRERQSTWSFYVESYDGANGYGLNEPNTDSVAVRVELIDVNDNPPQFAEKSMQVTITELFGVGRTIVELNCEDPDFDSFLQFYIIEGNELGHFGIRRSSISQRETLQKAELYVAGKLDYQTQNSYQLRLLASDSLNSDEILVQIILTQANTRAPKFNHDYKLRVTENSVAYDLVHLSADDEDAPDQTSFYRQFDERIKYSIVDEDEYPWFKLDDNRFSVIHGLDRDPPNGKPVWIVPISAIDGNNASIESLQTFALINITVEDVNDNGPFVVQEGPLILMEGSRKASVRFRLDDNDDWSLGHGGPFKLPTVVASTLDSYKNFTITQLAGGQGSSPTFNLIYSGNKLDRESGLKEFTVTINVKDAGGVGGRINIPIIIGDRNDNAQQDGEKYIHLLRYLGRTRCLEPFHVGDVFVEDLDDWDRREKTFTSLPENRFFEVDSFGQITINRKAARYMEEGEYEFKIDVFDRMFGTSVTGIVDFFLQDVFEKDIHNAAVLRLNDYTEDSFLWKSNALDSNHLEYLKGNVTALLGVQPGSVIVLNVVNGKSYIDVYLSVKGVSRNHLEHRLRQSEYLRRTFGIKTVSPDPCDSKDVCPKDMYCFSSRIVNAASIHLIDANRTALGALDVQDVADCVCSDYFDLESKRGQQCASSGGWCRNGGRCKDDGHGGLMCECPFGFDGPRCEALERTFEKNGFSKFKALDNCQPSRLHLEFSSLSEAKAGLLLLSGNPHVDPDTEMFFVAVQIVNGSLVVHLGKNTVVRLGKDVVDGNWHHVDIQQVGEIAKVSLDQCESALVHVSQASRKIVPSAVSRDTAMYLGGLPQRLKVQDVFRNVLAVHEFEGCLRNVIINGQFLDLFIPHNLEGSQYKDSMVAPCPCRHQIYCDVSMVPRVFVPSIPWWIWLIILSVVFILTASLSITLVNFMRKRNDMFLKRCYSAMDKNHEIDCEDQALRENLVRYGEGAGEQDQASFDINLLRKPVDTRTTYRSVNSPKHFPAKFNSGSQDSFKVFAYEGEGNSCNVSDLSSLSEPPDFPTASLRNRHQNAAVSRLASLFYSEGSSGSDSGSVEGGTLESRVSLLDAMGRKTHLESDI